MKEIIVFIAIMFVSFSIGFKIGVMKSKVEYVEKKVEVVKYVAQKRSKIQAEPNADRTELLKLMRNNRL